jgi:3-oxo-5-alpha-steroid 4-dehydrogenase 1
MELRDWFQIFVIGWILIAVVTFASLFKITAPYGRYLQKGWGLLINNRLGWIIMEIVSPLMFSLFFLTGSTEKFTHVWFFWALWLFHYVNRSLIFPFRIKTKGKKMPISIMFSAVFFNVVNGFTNGYYLGHISPVYPENWFFDIRFIAGLGLFAIGFIINFQSDEILLNLRKGEDTSYKIPKGGLYNWISSPNYFGEIIEWMGFALLTWSLPALGFALWTIANLVPRAISNHRWYLDKFGEYPKNRKAIIPYIW